MQACWIGAWGVAGSSAVEASGRTILMGPDPARFALYGPGSRGVPGLSPRMQTSHSGFTLVVADSFLVYATRPNNCHPGRGSSPALRRAQRQHARKIEVGRDHHPLLSPGQRQKVFVGCAIQPELMRVNSFVSTSLQH
jgi:hypothetical protein